MKSVLISGAAGFLGRSFVEHHINAGDDVYGIDNLSNEHSRWPDELEHRLQVDAGDYFSRPDDEGHRRYDLVYHFAAPVGGRVKIEGDPLFNADSLRLDSLFFRWAVRHTSLAVYPSSSAVYGVSFQGEKGHQLQEGMFHPGNPNWFAPDEMYGFTKLSGEMLAYKASAYGLNTLCIRPFSGYGEDQSLEYPIPSIAHRVALREDPLVVWGSGEQTRDFVHVDDVVGATVARLEAGVEGYQSMNIGRGHGVSFVTVARALALLALERYDGEYNPDIVTDPSKPEGVQNRWADVSRMERYYELKVPLRIGLGRVLHRWEVNRAK